MQAALGNHIRPDWDSWPTRLRGGIESRKLTQRRFAALVGVSPQTVTNWLSGSQISTDHLPAVADVLRLTIEELLLGSRGTEAPRASHEAIEITEAFAQLADELEPLERAVPDLLRVLDEAKRFVSEQ